LSNPLVSVIIPTYNSESILSKCLESIKNQTYKNIETIIVDNFSNDGTVKIAKKYEVRLFQSKSGMSMARNIGFQKSEKHSKYLLSIDSDMELMPEVIEQCVSLAESNNTNIGAIIIPERTVGNLTIAQIRTFERSFYRDTEVEAARFFRKHLVERVGGYDEDITFCEDRTLPQKIQQLGYNVKARINTEILHHEEHLSFSSHLRKKYQYGKSAGNYLKRYKKYWKKQGSLFYRLSLFLKDRRFYSKPLLAIAVLTLKTMEYISAGLGYFDIRMVKMSFKSILERSDLWLSKLLLAFSFLILISYTWIIGFSVKIVTSLSFIIIGSITYILIRNSEYTPKQVVIDYTKTYRLLLNIAFINIFTISILLLFKDLYIRPISYFILISILSVLIFLETEISDYKLILPKILLLSVNLRIGLLYKFPSIFGGDGAYHYGLIKEALLTGDIVGKAAFYSEYPIPHINTIIHMLIPGLNYKDALTTSWAFPRAIIAVLFIYLLGRELFNEKIGLISSLLIVLFPFDIWHSSHLAPMTFGNAIIPIMLYFFMFRKTNHHFLFGIVTLIIIAYSHPLTMVIVLVITFWLFIGSLFYKIIDKKSRVFPFILVLFIFFTRWAYFSRLSWIGRIVYKISDIYTIIILMLKESSFILETGYIVGNLSSFDEMLNTLGFSLFLCISVIGILFILRRKNKTIQVVEMLFATVLLAIIVIGFSSIGIWILPHRWFGPLGMLLVIPAAIGIQRALVKKSLSAIIMFIMAFFMITNSIANFDSPIYANEDTICWAFTESEISAADWSFQKANGILLDGNYKAYFRSLKFRYEPPKISSDDGIILIRNYILEHAFYKGEKYIFNTKYEKGERIKIEPSQISMLNEQEKNIILNLDQNLSKIYDNGNVNSYYQNPLQWIDKEK